MSTVYSYCRWQWSVWQWSVWQWFVWHWSVLLVRLTAVHVTVVCVTVVRVTAVHVTVVHMVGGACGSGPCDSGPCDSGLLEIWLSSRGMLICSSSHVIMRGNVPLVTCDCDKQSSSCHMWLSEVLCPTCPCFIMRLLSQWCRSLQMANLLRRDGKRTVTFCHKTSGRMLFFMINWIYASSE